MHRLSFILILIGLFGCEEKINQGAGFSSAFLTAATVEFDTESFLGSDGSGFSLKSVPLIISDQDHSGLQKLGDLFRKDVQHVLGDSVALLGQIPESGNVILVGSFDKSPLIRDLVKGGKIDEHLLKGTWEKYLITVVRNFNGNGQDALVIAGSDKRGAIFGMFDFSREMGVSPWYWWADVPIKRRDHVLVKEGTFIVNEPKVKYRGIFINDEAPALSGWVAEKFGGFNHQFYDRVFELTLRLKGNYLWPAMWGRAIYDDDPVSPELADEYGVVIGTTHHEPLMRAHVEWSRYGKGPWDYEKNPDVLEEFWREGIRRMGDNESIVSIGMRGDGDEAMTQGTAIALLEKIVDKQRQIISEETGKTAEQTPQLWALYKEVQEYYDQGMRVPDDVTLLLCDDNWGNIRKLPEHRDSLRTGGYGIYYHYDYVGGPRNYKWLNTNQISRTWEQMHMAWEYGADRIWIVNVGDIKPMEFPITFFLDYSWNPDAIREVDIPGYGEKWAEDNFGVEHAEEIASILEGYTRINSNRKPELLDANTYSLTNFREWERVVDDYSRLQSRAEAIDKKLSPEYTSAYFQLVLHPVLACANLNRMYFAVAKNAFYAAQKRVLTTKMAMTVDSLFDEDITITRKYHELNGGKWNHQMDQTHIGYTYWQQPEKNSIPETTKIEPPGEARPGIWVEGSKAYWPATNDLSLPEFDSFNDQTYVIEIFNQGQQQFEYTVQPNADWVSLSNQAGTVEDQVRVSVSVDWSKLKETASTELSVFMESDTVSINLIANRISDFSGKPISNGFAAYEAKEFTRKVESTDIQWIEIPQLGRTLSGIVATPVTSKILELGETGPRLEFDFSGPGSDTFELEFFFSPILNYHDDEGRKFGVSIDDGEIQVVNVHENVTNDDWSRWVSNNILTIKRSISVNRADTHTLKYWLIDPGFVLQKVVVRDEAGKASYLGEPSSFNYTKQIR